MQDYLVILVYISEKNQTQEMHYSFTTMRLLVLILSLVSLGWADINSRYFPKTLKIGVANAAAQIEGAWDEDGKGETIWDHYAHNFPQKISDGSNPDIAADSYHKYKEDVALVKAMGLDHYRFSIAWSRILPTGYPDQVNQPGIDYYKNLIAALKENDIEPMATLYHWDLPQPLEEEFGGFLSSKVTDLFAEFARICFEQFGDDVKMWITFNEPKQVCAVGYGDGHLAPGVVSQGVGVYECNYNLLIAHAKAYHVYDDEFREKQGGRVAINVDSSWKEPHTGSEADLEAQERDLQFLLGIYANPVFKGNWPQVVIDRVANRSELEGYSKSRLPEFTQEEIDYINGTSDYLALNHYYTDMVQSIDEIAIGEPSYSKDIGVKEFRESAWYVNGSLIVPWGLRRLLSWLKKTYGDVEIVITENGLADAGEMEDDNRITYFQSYISACLDAIFEDDVNLTYYTAWSIIDDWEWTGGYGSKLGMYSVDFDSPNRTRTPRKSAGFFTNIVKNRCLVDTCTE